MTERKQRSFHQLSPPSLALRDLSGIHSWGFKTFLNRNLHYLDDEIMFSKAGIEAIGITQK